MAQQTLVGNTLSVLSTPTSVFHPPKHSTAVVKKASKGARE